MNRKWPIIGAWWLLAATTTSVIVSVFTEAPRVITAALAAATGFVWLCQRRYVQHALSGATTTGVLLFAIFATDGAVKNMWPAPLLACGLLAGCRGIAECALRYHRIPAGMRVIWWSSAVFGISMLPFRRWASGTFWEGFNWRFIVFPVAAALIALLAQLAAAVFLVKTIPEAKQDERPAIALWLVLVAWMIAAPAR